MEQSDKAKRFLAGLDPESLKVGDGSDWLPIWIGIDAEAGRVYRVFATGLVTGFGDGNLVSKVGVGQDAGRVSDVSTMGQHIIHAFGDGMDRKMHFLELAAASSAKDRTAV